ncbi:MAG TPA: hypothetical protein PLI09_06625 [Candidatus Hydrogenedentes bacterium]|nr:hypothetical protein [Candidatus Hydrogenedentota bacterium]
MSDDEIMVMIFSVIAGIAGAFFTSTSRLPGVYTRHNPGIGLMRLAVVISVVWTWYVIQYHGDPSIKGVYVAFYLVMAYGITKICGQVFTGVYGVNLRVDVYERKNLAAALFVAAFTLATGIVFGGSLWGEADPLSDAEGGWWIPAGFFLMGWISLVVATALYLWREPGPFSRQIRRDLDKAQGWSVAVYVLSVSTLLLQGVAGDFWGWRHGILGMGTIAIMLVGHEAIAFAGRNAPLTIFMRLIEQGMYVGLAVLAWIINRTIDQWYLGG